MLVVLLRDQFNDWIPRLTGQAGDFEALVFSLVVIVMLQRAPQGLLSLVPARRRPTVMVPTVVMPTSAVAEVDGEGPHELGQELLALESVSRSFDGLVANRDISFSVRGGEIVA